MNVEEEEEEEVEESIETESIPSQSSSSDARSDFKFPPEIFAKKSDDTSSDDPVFDGEVESLISGMNMNIPDEVKKELSFDEDVINLTKKKISSLSDGVIGKPLTIDTSRISRYKR